MANRVIHFEVQADDVERAKEFYKKTFGWQITKLMNAGEGPMDYWGIMTGPGSEPGIDGGLYQRPADDKIYTYDCTIIVPDIDKAMEMVKKNGGKIIHEKSQIPNIGWFSRGLDPEGNKFGLMQSTGWEPEKAK